ncbi:cysteine proteinase [Tuber magnatum]|uniref:Cysteine proteinase n=1 Tax=Tuber magnatum TaxID=42249 RepID=A0A317SNN7_9PEZI|nr:cysteine proteinase [Tuber magnatum]
MPRPTYSKPISWGNGLRRNNHLSISPFRPSTSDPKTQHPSSQLAPSSHTQFSLHDLLSPPIRFVKTQTISGTLTQDQTMSSIGYLNKGMKRKGGSVSPKEKSPKKIRRDSSAENVDDQNLCGNEPLEQPQPLREGGVAEEDSVGGAVFRFSARKMKQPSPRGSNVSLKEKQNRSNQKPATVVPTGAKAGLAARTESGTVLSKEKTEKNGLKEVPHFPKSVPHNGSYIKSTILTPDSATAPLVSQKVTRHKSGSTKDQFENLKSNSDPIANASGKTVASEKSDPNTKPRDLSEESSKRYNNDMRVKGLNNSSYFCYRNSVLQFLSCSTVFVKEIVEHMKEKCDCVPICTSCALGKFFQNHFRPAEGEQTLNTNLLAVNRLRNILPEPFGGNQCNQEDASEYMLVLLNKGVDQLNSAPNGTNSVNYFDRIFGAKYDSILTCPACNNKSVTPEYQLNLQLALKVTRRAMINLNDCFADNFAEEIGGSAQTKIMNSVKLEEKIVLKEDNKDVTYKLRGIISHQGTRVRSGHYIAFVKQPDGTWAKCDDTWITESSLEV